MDIQFSDEYVDMFRIARGLTVHAHGLLHPTHLEWTVDGRLLASEFGRGRIVDVTEGGSYRDAPPFAFGLRHPAGLVTRYQGNQIIVADTGQGKIFDITTGGSIDDCPVVASGVPGPYGLALYQGDLYSTFSDHRQNGLLNVEILRNTGCVEDATTIAGFPNGLREMPYFLSPTQEQGECGSWTALGVGDQFLYLHAGLGAVYNVKGFARYSVDVPIICRGLNKPLGMLVHPKTGYLFVVERGGGTVKVVPKSQFATDMRYVPPIAAGFREPSCLRFSADGQTMFVCDVGACCIWRVDIS